MPRDLDDAAACAKVPREREPEGWADYDDFKSLAVGVQILIECVRQQDARIEKLEAQRA